MATAALHDSSPYCACFKGLLCMGQAPIIGLRARAPVVYGRRGAAEHPHLIQSGNSSGVNTAEPEFLETSIPVGYIALRGRQPSTMASPTCMTPMSTQPHLADRLAVVDTPRAGGRQRNLPGMHRRGCGRQKSARYAPRAPRVAQHASQRTTAARRPATTPPGRTEPPARRRAAPSRARAQRRCRRFGGGPCRSLPDPEGWLVARRVRGTYVGTHMGAPTPGSGCRASRHCRGARDRKPLTWRVCWALGPRHRNRQCVYRRDPRERRLPRACMPPAHLAAGTAGMHSAGAWTKPYAPSDNATRVHRHG